MKTDAIDKNFDCLKMKSDIQAEVYAEIKDMSASERIAYYKEGTKEFWKPTQNFSTFTTNL
ncbi:hypothetical protein R83H12_00231 [Fibrobacteria bacterium R8-3-H12]